MNHLQMETLVEQLTEAFACQESDSIPISMAKAARALSHMIEHGDQFGALEAIAVALGGEPTEKMGIPYSIGEALTRLARSHENAVSLLEDAFDRFNNTFERFVDEAQSRRGDDGG